MVVAAIHNTPGIDKDVLDKSINKALTYVLKFAQKDGSIYPAKRDMASSKNYPNYGTATALIALATVNRPQDLKYLKAAREFLKKSQFTDKSKIDFGGIGYGKTGRADMSNLSFSSEALYFTEYLDKEPFNKDPKAAEKLNTMWKNMQTFITQCQNLPATNKNDFVSDDPRDFGGFFYRPNESKAGDRDDSETKSKLISSASVTYAGLKSMMYSRLDKEDVRVKGALKYLTTNYELDENPGMGLQGLYYYLNVMAKALDAYGTEYLTDNKGVKHQWRKDIIEKVLSLQHKDGYWQNSNGRFYESKHTIAGSQAIVVLKVAMGKAPLKYK